MKLLCIRCKLSTKLRMSLTDPPVFACLTCEKWFTLQEAKDAVKDAASGLQGNWAPMLKWLESYPAADQATVVVTVPK